MPPSILDIPSFKARFDPLLSSALDACIDHTSRFSGDSDSAALLAHVKTLALAGGKRIRPYVAYLMYQTAGGIDEDDIFQPLIALELFHVFALIHDDIIDCGVMRHGVQTLNEYARSRQPVRTDVSDHRADGIAMLIGDLVFSWSKERFVRAAAASGRGYALELFDDMTHAVVLGQILDVTLMAATDPSEAQILQKTFLKTAKYTFTYPMRIGASLSSIDHTYDAWCERMGDSLGLAFQLQDDLLDITGAEHVTGKRSLHDVEEGQHTVFTAYVRKNGTEADRATLDAYFGKECDDASRLAMQDIFERSGAVAYGRHMISDELATATQVLSQQDMPDIARESWRALVRMLENRSV